MTRKPIHPRRATFSKSENLEEAKKLFSKFYSANLMSVCISSNKSIAELEKIALKFKSIKNKKATPPPMVGRPPYGPPDCKRLIKMDSISKEHEMRVIWSLPYYGNRIYKMNLSYFKELFGHQGPKSIITFLKREGLATALRVQKQSLSDMTKFEVIIQLTKDGYDNP